jgi:Major tropism determinant N-terminal domain
MALQLRRDTTSGWSTLNPILALGELAEDITLGILKLGDGVTHWNDLLQYGVGPTGATGPAGPHGEVTIDFGPLPGNNEASIFVSDTNVLATSKAFAQFEYDSTVDHTQSDHLHAALFSIVICSDCTAGVGFTIYAASTEKLSGTFKIIYSWS